MDKLNLKFDSGDTLYANQMNAIVNAINLLVDEKSTSTSETSNEGSSGSNNIESTTTKIYNYLTTNKVSANAPEYTSTSSQSLEIVDIQKSPESSRYDYRIYFTNKSGGSNTTVSTYTQDQYNATSTYIDVKANSYPSVSHLVAKLGSEEKYTSGEYHLPIPGQTYQIASWLQNKGNNIYEIHFRVFGVESSQWDEHLNDVYRYTINIGSSGGVSYTNGHQETTEFVNNHGVGYAKIKVDYYPIIFSGFTLDKYDWDSDGHFGFAPHTLLAEDSGYFVDDPTPQNINGYKIDTYDFTNPISLKLATSVNIPNRANGDAVYLTNNTATASNSKITFLNVGDGSALYGSTFDSDHFQAWSLHVRQWGSIRVETLNPDDCIQYIQYYGGTLGAANSVTKRYTPYTEEISVDASTNWTDEYITKIVVVTRLKTGTNTNYTDSIVMKNFWEFRYSETGPNTTLKQSDFNDGRIILFCPKERMAGFDSANRSYGGLFADQNKQVKIVKWSGNNVVATGHLEPYTLTQLDISWLNYPTGDDGYWFKDLSKLAAVKFIPDSTIQFNSVSGGFLFAIIIPVGTVRNFEDGPSNGTEIRVFGWADENLN